MLEMWAREVAFPIQAWSEEECLDVRDKQETAASDIMSFSICRLATPWHFLLGLRIGYEQGM